MSVPSASAILRSRVIVLGLAVLAAVSAPVPLHAADALTVVRLGLLSSDNSANAYYAQEMGYFKSAGLDVQITTLQGGPVAAQAVASGALDIGTGNVATIAAARIRGIGLKFIAPASVSNPSTMTDVIAVAKDSPFKTAADLNAKTFGINAIKALPQVSVMSWMDKHGGDSKTVKFVELAFSQMGSALAAHRIDAALEVEPFVTNDKGVERVLGPALDGLGPHVMILGFFASDAWLAEHPDTAAKFVSALRQASEWANGHRRETGAILARYTKMEPGVIAEMARAEYGIALDPAVISPVIDGAVRYGIIDKHVPAADLLWKR
ncbi:MAG TPA: ABC transporter substrate-binding protein [Candidatus Lustribacter sp.]